MDICDDGHSGSAFEEGFADFLGGAFQVSSILTQPDPELNDGKIWLPYILQSFLIMFNHHA